MKKVITESVAGHPFRFKTTARAHSWTADTVPPKGGDTAANPVEHMMGALAECIAMTAEAIATNKKYPVTKIRVTVTLDEVDEAGTKVYRFGEHLDVDGPLTDQQMEGLKAAVKVCTVFKILDGKKLFEPTFNLNRPPAVDTAGGGAAAPVPTTAVVAAESTPDTTAPTSPAKSATPAVADSASECKS